MTSDESTQFTKLAFSKSLGQDLNEVKDIVSVWGEVDITNDSYRHDIHLLTRRVISQLEHFDLLVMNQTIELPEEHTP